MKPSRDDAAAPTSNLRDEAIGERVDERGERLVVGVVGGVEEERELGSWVRPPAPDVLKRGHTPAGRLGRGRALRLSGV
jgi:hypothetical protein